MLIIDIEVLILARTYAQQQQQQQKKRSKSRMKRVDSWDDYNEVFKIAVVKYFESYL